MKIIDTEITKLTIPVRPGRNVSVIIEVAAMNYRLKKSASILHWNFLEGWTRSLQCMMK